MLSNFVNLQNLIKENENDYSKNAGMDQLSWNLELYFLYDTNQNWSYMTDLSMYPFSMCAFRLCQVDNLTKASFQFELNLKR